MYKSLLVAIVIIIYSCQQTQQQSTSLTNTERTAVTDSIKTLIKQFKKECEEVDADGVMSLFSKSENTRVVDQNANVIYPIDSIYAVVRGYYSGLTHQVLKTSEPFINVLTPDYAVVIDSSDFTAFVKDSTTIGGPVAWTFVLARESGQWKILNLQQAVKWREPSPQKLK